MKRKSSGHALDRGLGVRRRDGVTGQWGLLITFKAEGADKLARFTRDHINQKAGVIIRGQLVMVATIVDEIRGGKMVAHGSFRREEVEEIAELFRHRDAGTDKGRSLFR